MRTDANGQPLSGTSGLTFDPYGYTGAPHDPNGLIYLQSRYYQPSLQAFLTADTPAAGMLNAYTYATGDPINHTDPTGMAPEWVTWGNAMTAGGLLGSLAGGGMAFRALPATGPIAVGFAAAALVSAAADIAINADYFGIAGIDLPADVRTGLEYASLSVGMLSMATGFGATKTAAKLRAAASKPISNAITAYRAELKFSQRQAASALRRTWGDTRPTPLARDTQPHVPLPDADDLPAQHVPLPAAAGLPAQPRDARQVLRPRAARNAVDQREFRSDMKRWRSDCDAFVDEAASLLNEHTAGTLNRAVKTPAVTRTGLAYNSAHPEAGARGASSYSANVYHGLGADQAPASGYYLWWDPSNRWSAGTANWAAGRR